jgi:uracil phosphoribosyltransferase
MLELLPNAGIHHIGMYHNQHQAVPEQYYNRLPKKYDFDVAFIFGCHHILDCHEYYWNFEKGVYIICV